MQRIPVESSDLVSVGYDDVSRTLEIEFKEGRIYNYFDVPQDIYKGLIRAESPGTYFFAHINAYFRYRKVSEQSRFVFSNARTVTFVTSNPLKLRNMQQACVPLGITVKHQMFDIDEIQAHDPIKVAEHKLTVAFKRTGGIPTVINDDFWTIPALNGFPGGYMRDVNQWFTDTDFVHLMQDKTDRTIILTQTVMYKDDTQGKTFTYERRGVITPEPRGRGDALERVVIFDGSNKTWAEQREQEGRVSQDNPTVWRDFAAWYTSKR